MSSDIAKILEAAQGHDPVELIDQQRARIAELKVLYRDLTQSGLVAVKRMMELQAVVDKLPKCWRLNDEGKLVQDVPVTPGMRLWEIADPIDSGTASHVTVGGCEFVRSNSIVWRHAESLYSTPEAARAHDNEQQT